MSFKGFLWIFEGVWSFFCCFDEVLESVGRVLGS